MRATELTELSRTEQRLDPVETITAELLPTCSALRYIARHGSRVLKTRSYNAWGRPGWLWGVRSRVCRKPLGKVLVLGTWNYPVFLPGVQAAQALAAGNSVLLKPAAGCEQVTACLLEAFHEAGVPRSCLQLLPSDTEAAVAAIERGVDLIVLTGASETGRKVLRQAAGTLTPAIMELSGCDAVIVLPNANLERVADCVIFGLGFNGGATCIAPRRIIAGAAEADLLKERLIDRLAQAAPQSYILLLGKQLLRKSATLWQVCGRCDGKFQRARLEEIRSDATSASGWRSRKMALHRPIYLHQ